MFSEKLNLARNGRGILFCGAGFSASALNFSEHEEIGVGAHLLAFLNVQLKEKGFETGFKDLRNAADAALEAFGEFGLMSLLQKRFKLENVSADMVDIVKFPWERIYTTNYDNAIEIALLRAKVNSCIINNTQNLNEISEGVCNVIHLHGRAISWNISNFKQSCILGEDSYNELDFISEWLDLFREDLDRAEIVVFVGFNAADFHLNKVLRNVTGLKEKVYFVNRPTASPDPDIKRTQSRFGEPLYIGREGMAEKVREVLSSSRPKEPALSSFERFKRAKAAQFLPETRAIEELLVFGIISEEQLARDIGNNISDYHILRSTVNNIVSEFRNDKNIILLTGDICEGKTLVAKGVSQILDLSRPVFNLRIPYDDILDEVSEIMDVYKDAVVVIENCFDLTRSRLVSLASQFDGKNALLLLTSRTIAAEARSSDMVALKALATFQHIKMSSLDDVEVGKLSGLADQIAGWSEFRARSLSDRTNYIKNTCNSSIPSFLLRLLRSKYVRDKYREEYNKINGLSKNERMVLIGALYIAHIGDRPHISFLSDIFKIDVHALLDKLNNSFGLKLLRLRGNIIETVPSIGATNILKEVVPDDLIVEVVSFILRELSESHTRDDFRRHIFSQLMRYSIIKPVLDDEKFVTRFFDNVSKIEYVRRHVLFWLQWSIAYREQGKFVDAESTLDQGYREAEMYEKRIGKPFDRTQLDDVRAKLLVARAKHTPIESGQLYRDFQDICGIIGRLLKVSDLTHHPYETLVGAVSLFDEKNNNLSDRFRELTKDTLLKVTEFAGKRIGLVPVGYQSSMANAALKEAKEKMAKL